MKILKKGGSREKGEEETKCMPHAPVQKTTKYNTQYKNTKTIRQK